MSDSSGGMSMKGGGRVKDKPKKKKTKTKVKTKDDGPKLSASEQFYGTSGKVEQPMADYYDRYTTEAVDPISMLPPDYFNRLGGYLFQRSPDEGGENPPVQTQPAPPRNRPNPQFPDMSHGTPMIPLNIGGMFAGPNNMGSETIEFDPSMLEATSQPERTNGIINRPSPMRMPSSVQEDFGSLPTEQFGMAGRKAIIDRNRAALAEEPAPTKNLTVKRKKVVTPPVFADANFNDFESFDPMRFAPRGMGIF